MRTAKAVIYVTRLGDEVEVQIEGHCCPVDGGVVEYATTADGRDVRLTAYEQEQAENALLASLIASYERAREMDIDTRIDAARGK